ncbi:MAG: cobalt ECF transporter T component CbiQ [bacterium]
MMFLSHSDIRHRPGPLSEVDPRLKLLILVSYLLCAVSLEPGQQLAALGMFVCLIALITVSLLPFGAYALKFAKTLPLFLLLAIPILFFAPGEVVWRWEVWPVVSVTDRGIELFGCVMIRGLLALGALILFASVTPLPQQIFALQFFRCPRILLLLLGFLYRYGFMFQEEATRLWRAREARHISLSPKAELASMGGLVGVLLVRATERAERIYASMLMRGFDGRVRLLDPPNWSARQIVASLVCVAALFIVRFGESLIHA